MARNTKQKSKARKSGKGSARGLLPRGKSSPLKQGRPKGAA